MTTKTLEILIVEDKEKHIADAKKTIEKLTNQGVLISADYATTLKEALEKIEQKKYDKVVSDVFYPTGMENDSQIRTEIVDTLRKYFNPENPWEAPFGFWKNCSKDMESISRFEAKVEGYAKAFAGWLDESKIPPSGIYLAEKLGRKGIVFCTDTHHHGLDTQPVTNYAKLITADRKRLDGIKIEIHESGGERYFEEKNNYEYIAGESKPWESAIKSI